MCDGILKSDKKTMTNIMDMYKLKVIKYSKNPDYKTNKNKKGKKYIWNTFQDTIDQSFLKKSNWGIVCNKMSGVFGLDLDTHKWEKDNLFNKDWGDIESFINNIDTYTQTTPNGGIHMVFQYDDEIDQTESKMNSNFGKGIDIRNGHDNKINSGGYLLGAGSVFKKPDGTIGTYKIVNDKSPIVIPPELKKWLLDNIYTNMEHIKKKIKKEKCDPEIVEKKAIEHNIYSYLITEKQFKTDIIDKIDKKYFTEYIYWLHLTTAMKILKLKELWDCESKKHDGYNYTNNHKIWDGLDISGQSYYVESLYREIKEFKGGLWDEYVAQRKYKKVDNDIKKPNRIITRTKLTRTAYEGKEKDRPLIINLKDSINYCLKSDTGTGKTTLMKNNLFNSNQKFVSIVSRISLGKEQYKSFNEHGIDCKFYASHHCEEGDSIITTIDSILGCGSLMKNIGEYTIFIDEFNSVLEYIFQADTCLSKSRSRCWKYLIHMLKNCKNFVCVDADISDLCFQFLDYLSKPYKYIRNDYKHNKGVDTTECASLDDFIDIIDGCDKYMVCCDSKKAAEYIWLETGSKAKLLTGSSDKLDGETLDDYDKIIFSPAIIYGLDSSINRPIFAYHKENTISPKNMLQQISRCRNITHLYFCFQKQWFSKCKYLDMKECEDHMEKIIKFTNDQFDVLEPEETERQKLFNDLYTLYLYKQDAYNSNKYIHFRLLLIERGFNVNDCCIKTKVISPEEKFIMNTQITLWKEATLDINCERIQKFNNEYLGLTNSQLEDIKKIFILDDYFISNVFLIKKYFEMGHKNIPLFNAEKEYQKIKDSAYAKEVTPENVALFYDMEENYNTLNWSADIKSKKINASKFKMYMIDKFKSITNYTGIHHQEYSNVIKCSLLPSQEQRDNFINKYNLIFDYRGKKELKLNTTYDCEKLLGGMMNRTFNSLYKSKKIRNGSETKMIYFLSQGDEALSYARRITNFQRFNKFKDELHYTINEKMFKGTCLL